MELISNPSDKNCFGKTRNELAHFHATSFKRAFGLVILFALLGACSPTINEKPTLTSIIKTSTQELVTFTPQSTATFTITPTAILPPMQILRTATPGPDMISSQNAGNVEVVGIYGNGRAYSAMWSANDKFFTVDTTLGMVLYDAQTWQPIPFSDSFGAYSIFEWSPDGKRLAAASAFVEETPMVYVYDGETLQQIKIVKTGDRFSWSPDGQNLAIIGDDSVHFYNSQSLDEIAKIIINQPIWRYSFSPDGKRFATLEKNQIRVWDVFTGEKLLAYDVELNDNRSC